MSAAPSEEETTPERPLPEDPAGWRSLLASIPPRTLLRLVQEDSFRALRLLAGFRPTADSLKAPAVVSRLIEETRKDPTFGRTLVDAVPEAKPRQAPPSPKPVIPPPPSGSASDEKARDKVKEQRGILRDKDRRIAELEAEIRRVEKERDRALADVENAQEQRRQAEEHAERLRRRSEREERKPVPPAPPQPKVKSPPPAAPALPPAAPSPWREGVERLLSRGRFDTVIEICRETLAAGGEGDPALHTLYARALREKGHLHHAAAQEKMAAAAFLDAADVLAAADAFVRCLPFLGDDIDGALLRRLLVLARRDRCDDRLRTMFERVRVTDTDTYQRLYTTLNALGAEYADFLQAPAGRGIGPDEAISLPEGGLGATTPRRLVGAVEGNDEVYVSRARSGIRRLQASNPQVTEALFDAIKDLNPAALSPLTASPRPVVVDASNVARYDPDPLALSPPPHVDHLIKMRDFLLRRGFFPIVMIADANLRFHVDDRSTYLRLMEQGLIRETLSGTAADDALIAESLARTAPLVTNDRLWDWDGAEEVERLSFAIFPNGVSFSF